MSESMPRRLLFGVIPSKEATAACVRDVTVGRVMPGYHSTHGDNANKQVDHDEDGDDHEDGGRDGFGKRGG
ncbi:hypothetical protein [Bradyrhizobium amphicarpaeae]|uniref:hypothetical protein n=1 Tax=Bradyrhizobium amphicarpaeae TaxID=1404768 RepID=UPI0011E4D1F0|nr:hypothetical protein [Bradyrhizobium amphicarpaeae]